jgi:type 1 glutamine amidotransferase
MIPRGAAASLVTIAFAAVMTSTACSEDTRVPTTITWRQDFGAPRLFYTGMGHTPESWREEPFVTMMLQTVAWAGGQ